MTGAAHGRVCPMQDREMQGSLRPALRLSPHGAGGKGSPRTLTRFHRERESWDMNSGVHGPALLGWEREKWSLGVQVRPGLTKWQAHGPFHAGRELSAIQSGPLWDYYSHHQLKTEPSSETRRKTMWALQGQLVSEHVPLLSPPTSQAPNTRCHRRGKQALLLFLLAASSQCRTDRRRTGR